MAGLAAVEAIRYGNIVGSAHRCGFGADAVVRRGSVVGGRFCKMCVGDGETEQFVFFLLGRDTYL